MRMHRSVPPGRAKDLVIYDNKCRERKGESQLPYNALTLISERLLLLTQPELG